jgi:acetyl esterase/lipase
VAGALAGVLVLAGCAPAASLGGLMIPTTGHRLEAGITYGDDPRQRLDVYRPDGVTEPVAVVVFLYGGSWRSGERGYYRFIGEALTSRGFVVVVPDYRLYPQVRFPAFVEDGAQGVRWVHGNIARFGGDPGRIFLMGHSAGAHIAALLAVERRYLEAVQVPPTAIRGLIGLAGPYALDPSAYRFTRKVFAGIEDPRIVQPAALVSGDEPPVLLLHGLDDRLVPADNSRAFAANLAAHGRSAESLEYAETGHIDLVLALGHPFRRPGGIRDRIAAFITAH